MKCITLLLLFLSSTLNAAEIHRLLIQIHYVDNLKDIPLNKFFNYPPKFAGFGYPNPHTGICDVFVLKPKDENDKNRMEILGHEIMHCTDGAYHDLPEFIKK